MCVFNRGDKPHPLWKCNHTSLFIRLALLLYCTVFKGSREEIWEPLAGLFFLKIVSVQPFSVHYIFKSNLKAVKKNPNIGYKKTLEIVYENVLQVYESTERKSGEKKKCFPCEVSFSRVLD